MTSKSTELVPIPQAECPDSQEHMETAQWTYERLVTFINKFEADLDDEHEVGARLVSFGSEITFHIEDIGYWEPDIITFYGVGSDGGTVQLIQNVSQLSVLLVAMQKREEEPRRVGFDLGARAKAAAATKADSGES